jgi:very-short-patch-repair endonuclease
LGFWAHGRWTDLGIAGKLRSVGDFNAPFRGSLAADAGLLTKGQLRGPRFRKLFPDIYLPKSLAPTLAMRSRGAHLLIAGSGALAGYSAAELLGARIAPRDADAEVMVPGGEFRECRGLRVHREQLADDEVVTVDGLVVTSAIRTAYDLARWSAESAMETRCRLSLVLRGLPRPELQYQLRDEVGDHVAWLDMAYPCARAGVEFDGEHHQEALVFRTDLARHNRLAALGWTVLRASAADVLRNLDRFAAQVRAVLHQRAA